MNKRIVLDGEERKREIRELLSDYFMGGSLDNPNGFDGVYFTELGAVRCDFIRQIVNRSGYICPDFSAQTLLRVDRVSGADPYQRGRYCFRLEDVQLIDRVLHAGPQAALSGRFSALCAIKGAQVFKSRFELSMSGEFSDRMIATEAAIVEGSAIAPVIGVNIGFMAFGPNHGNGDVQFNKSNLRIDLHIPSVSAAAEGRQGCFDELMEIFNRGYERYDKDRQGAIEKEKKIQDHLVQRLAEDREIEMK